MSLAHHVRTAALWLCAASTAHAASFDCSRAAGPVEKLICHSPQLSTLDDELTVKYARALKQTPNPESLKKQQRGWLGNVRNRCTTAECLKSAYTARAAQLDWIGTSARTAPRVPLTEDAASCHMMANLGNREELKTLAVDFLATQAGHEYLRTIFGDDVSFGGVNYWHVDLDNDGVPDHLVISVDGSARFATAYARSGKKGAEVATLPGENDDPFLDLDLLAVGGRYYFSGGDKVWRMTMSGDFRKVCSFSVRERHQELIMGKQNAVCVSASQGKINYIEYSLVHRLRSLPDDPQFGRHELQDGSMAQADIDNDGKLDNLVRVSYMAPGGRPCAVNHLAATNPDRTAIPDTPLNRLLLSDLDGESECRSLDTFFVHRGTTYLDTRYTDTHNPSKKGSGKIFRIKDGKAETVCEFHERILFDAIVDE